MLHPAKFYCFNLMPCNEVFMKSRLLHNSLMLLQCIEALLFLQNVLVEVINHLPLEMCICTHSLVVDDTGCSQWRSQPKNLGGPKIGGGNWGGQNV